MNKLNTSLSLSLLAVAIVGVACALPAYAQERKDEVRTERRTIVRVDAKNSAEIQVAVDDAKEAAAQARREAAQARREADQARKEADLARAEASIDVREIRETIRKSIDDANQYGAMISRRSSSDELVKGNPYSAREVREFKQTLGDGTVISRQSTRLLARDREGRLRQELRQPDGTARVFINDPVAKEVLILDPQKKTACRATFREDEISQCITRFERTLGEWKPLGFLMINRGKGGIGLINPQDHLTVAISPTAQIIDIPSPSTPTPPIPPARSVGAALSQSRTAISGGMVPENTTLNRKLNNEKYEGLSVSVERTVETIVAGAIGNNKAIESTYERYYSPDLKMTVYVRRNDPRNGESLYRMTDIKRTDPDPNAFKIPSSYTVTEGKK